MHRAPAKRRTQRTRERKKREKKETRKTSERGRGRPKAFCSPFTEWHSRTRKTCRVRGKTRREPRETSERASKRETERKGEKEKGQRGGRGGQGGGEREKIKGGRREMETAVRPFWSRCKLERPLETPSAKHVQLSAEPSRTPGLRSFCALNSLTGCARSRTR